MISRRQVVHLVGTPVESQCREIYSNDRSGSIHAQNLASYVNKCKSVHDELKVCFPSTFQKNYVGEYVEAHRDKVSSIQMKLAYGKSLGIQLKLDHSDEFASAHFFNQSLQEVDFYLYAFPKDVPDLLKWFDKHKDSLPTGATFTIAVCSENKVALMPARWSDGNLPILVEKGMTKTEAEVCEVSKYLTDNPGWSKLQAQFKGWRVRKALSDQRKNSHDDSVAGYRTPKTFDFQITAHPLPDKLGEAAHVKNKLLHCIAQPWSI